MNHSSQPNCFSHISLSEWRQFECIDIDLHPRLTVLTGANGSGKSTLLSILEGNLIGGQNSSFLATPEEDEKSRATFFSISNVFSSLKKVFSDQKNQSSLDQEPIGKITLSDDTVIKVSHPPVNSIQYVLQFNRQPLVNGFRIGSHRPLPSYQQINVVPVMGIAPKLAEGRFRSASQQYGSMNSSENPLNTMKQTLISFAIHGSSNQNVRAVPEIEGLFDEFDRSLAQLLPRELKFRKLVVRPPEVVVITDTGDFPIDGASGGLMSLIQITWQVFLFSKANNGACVVLIDEPENHLHPSLQREFLSNLVSVFPMVQFVVATHSPFIICSVKDSYIYALRHKPLTNNSTSSDQKAAVNSEKIDLGKSVGTASRILDEVLGVSVTMPVWAERELDAIVRRFENEESDEAAIRQLRQGLSDAGMSEFLPQAISKLLS